MDALVGLLEWAGIYVAVVAAGWLGLAILLGTLALLVHACAAGWHGVIHLLHTPSRRRKQRELEQHRWQTWRPKQDLRRLPH